MRALYWIVNFVAFGILFSIGFLSDSNIIFAALLMAWCFIVTPVIDYIFIKKRKLYDKNDLIRHYPFWSYRFDLFWRKPGEGRRQYNKGEDEIKQAQEQT